VRLQVPCNDAMHEVVYKPHPPQKQGRPPRPGGPLGFGAHHFKELQRELNTEEIGDEPCHGCTALLSDWRRFVVRWGSRNPPAELRSAAEDAYNRHARRDQEHSWSYDVMAINPWHERPLVLLRALKRVLQNHWGLPPGLTYTVEWSAHRYSNYRILISDKQTTLLSFIISRRWCAKIYAKGRHFHQDRLVVNTYPRNETCAPTTDFLLRRVWPVWGHGGALEFYQDRVEVAMQPDGSWMPTRKPRHRGFSPPPPAHGSQSHGRPPGQSPRRRR